MKKSKNIATNPLSGSNVFVHIALGILVISCSEKCNSSLCCGKLLDLKIKNQRNKVQVWLPEEYSESTKYSVIYMHDGQMLFDSCQTWNGKEWRVDETLNQLAEEGETDACIVVAIWNSGASRRDDYMPQKPFGLLSRDLQDSLIQFSKTPDSRSCFEKGVYSDEYIHYIVYEVKPMIDSMFSTHRGRDHTFIMGSSMGGLISLYALCEYPEVFGGAACLSTHWPGVHDYRDHRLSDTLIHWFARQLAELENQKLYMDYGTAALDKHYGRHQLKFDSLVGFSQQNYLSLKIEGAGHSEQYWSERLRVPLKFLLQD